MLAAVVSSSSAVEVRIVHIHVEEVEQRLRAGEPLEGLVPHLILYRPHLCVLFLLLTVTDRCLKHPVRHDAECTCPGAGWEWHEFLRGKVQPSRHPRHQVLQGLPVRS